MSRQEESRSVGLIGAFVSGADVNHLSTALVVAAIEFAGCAGILLALSVLGAISPVTATLWGAMILVPLSLTIGCLGVGVGMAGKREGPSRIVLS